MGNTDAIIMTQRQNKLTERSRAMDRQTINEKFKELAQYKQMEAEIKALKEEIEAEIKVYMQTEKIESLVGDEHHASYTTYEERRFDSTAFKKDHADMYEAYRKASTKSKFTFA